MYRPKSRAEIYKEKLKEREIYTNNVLDRFTENGGGAPLRNKDGSIMTKRRTMLNNDYEDYFLNNQRNRNTTPLSYNYNQQINSLQDMRYNMNNNTLNYNNNYQNNQNNQNNFYQTLPVGIIDNNVYNMRNVNDRENENVLNNNNYNNNYINANNNFNNENLNVNNNNNYMQRSDVRDYDHYEGTGVILKENGLDENNKRKYRNLREEWLKEIEEKKEREASRKKREREEELKIEEKYRKELEEEKERERLEKMKFNDNLRDISNTNLKMMENNKKKKNIIDIENTGLNNINNINNYNPKDIMAMNGNNLEQVQNNMEENQIIENETNAQNFGIIRDQNNIDINNNINNNNQMNEIEFDSNNPQELEENINMQIAKLRDDVNNQYIEMSNLFGKLKMDVIEATQLKNEAEKELQYIRKELAKNKMASLAYDAELNQALEKHAPYNNLHINIKEVDPLYSLRNVRKDIQTTSNMIYSTDMINEQNVNRVKQLSALAQAGQNLIGLKAESEFIPISNPNENNNNNEYNGDININNNIGESDPKNNIAISKTGYKNLENESYPIYQQENINNKENNEFNNEPKILDDYMNKGEYSNMYKQLVDIANINHEMGSENKLKTLNKNYDIDYNNFNKKHSEQQKKIINNFDQLLNEIN